MKNGTYSINEIKSIVSNQLIKCVQLSYLGTILYDFIEDHDFKKHNIDDITIIIPNDVSNILLRNIYFIANPFGDYQKLSIEERKKLTEEVINNKRMG